MSRSKALTVFAHADVSSIIYSYGSTADMVLISRVSSAIHYGLKDRLRDRLAKHLSRWVSSRGLMHEMRETTLSLFDQSSYAFLNSPPSITQNLTTLYLVCIPSETARIVAFFVENGYHQITALSARRQTSHLSLNKFISAPYVMKKGGLTIALVSTLNNSIPQVALGCVTTAFMSIIGPDSFWSAYRTGPQGEQSFQNPSYHSDPCPQGFSVKIDLAHKICRECDVRNHLLIYRTLVERPHKTLCYLHPDCPQTLRTSIDPHCIFMYFGRNHQSVTAKDLREQASRSTFPVIWRLGGVCYKHTVQMTPISLPVPSLEKPLFDYI